MTREPNSRTDWGDTRDSSEGARLVCAGRGATVASIPIPSSPEVGLLDGEDVTRDVAQVVTIHLFETLRDGASKTWGSSIATEEDLMSKSYISESKYSMWLGDVL